MVAWLGLLVMMSAGGVGAEELAASMAESELCAEPAPPPALAEPVTVEEACSAEPLCEDADEPPPVDAASRQVSWPSVRVEQVEILREPTPAIRIRLSRPAEPLVKVLPPDGIQPHRIYVDLQAALAPAARTVGGSALPILGVRSGQFDHATARIVIELRSPAPHVVHVAGRTVTVAVAVPAPRMVAVRREKARVSAAAPPATAATTPTPAPATEQAAVPRPDAELPAHARAETAESLVGPSPADSDNADVPGPAVHVPPIPELMTPEDRMAAAAALARLGRHAEAERLLAQAAGGARPDLSAALAEEALAAGDFATARAASEPLLHAAVSPELRARARRTAERAALAVKVDIDAPAYDGLANGPTTGP